MTLVPNMVEYLSELFDHPLDRPVDIVPTLSLLCNIGCDPPLLEEIIDVLHLSKFGKSPSENGIPEKMY